MAVSREIMSIMAGLDALAEPSAEAARPLPGKTAQARVEGILRCISGTILSRQIVLRAGDGSKLEVFARNGRLVGTQLGADIDAAEVGAAIVALARADGPHRVEIAFSDGNAGADGVGHSTSDLRVACTTAMAEAEAESSADFSEQLAALSAASAALGSEGLENPVGDAARLPDRGALAALVADLSALEAELAHLGGAPALFVVGAPDDPLGQTVLVGGQAKRVAALAPGNQAKLLRGWGAALRASGGN